MATFEPGQQLPEVKVTPDRYLTVRYAGASGDFNPIHVDEEFAKQVGLPGRILHGLWTMAQVVTVRSTVREVADGVVHVDTEAWQADTAIIRRGDAELQG
jgi:acyl dehydratase